MTAIKNYPERQRVGRLIRGGREAAGLSQSQLAARVGASRNNISRIEGGSYSVSLDILSTIASALGRSVEMLPCPESVGIIYRRIADVEQLDYTEGVGLHGFGGAADAKAVAERYGLKVETIRRQEGDFLIARLKFPAEQEAATL